MLPAVVNFCALLEGRTSVGGHFSQVFRRGQKQKLPFVFAILIVNTRYDNSQADLVTLKSADLDRLRPPFRAGNSARRVSASPATAGFADPPVRRRGACARPWRRDVRRDILKIVRCERFGE